MTMAKVKTQNSKESPIKINKHAWTAAIILTFVCGFLFLRSFVPLIMLAGLMAFFTTPIYEKLLLKLKGKSGLAASLTTISLFLIIGVPVIGIMAVAVAQAVSLANSLNLGQLFEGSSNFSDNLNTVVAEANELIQNLTGIDANIDPDSITSFMKETLPQVVNYVADSILAIVSSIPSFFMNLIIFLFVYIGILTNSARLIELFHNLSPFDRNVNNLYFKRIGLMANAMLKGQFIIATLQGLATAIGLSIVGLNGYFFFFFVIFTFLSLIPLGAGIITIPLGILALLTGYVWQGLVILGNHFIIVTNIDNIRPKLVPKEARMQAALTILAAFAGVSLYGLLGVIYGPIIMIILVTTIETYIEVKKITEAEE